MRADDFKGLGAETCNLAHFFRFVALSPRAKARGKTGILPD
jgi:hypothetical protein